jgi:hypothetical protein
MKMDAITQDQISSLERIALIIAKSGMGGFRTPEQATAALLLALAENIPLGRVLHEYHVINGRLSLRSECMLARFQKAGGCLQYIERNDAAVSVQVSHPRGGSLSVTWTIDRARKAGLTTNPTWQKHPTAMLSARAVAEAIRAVYPACLSGIITEAEAEELPAEPLPQILPSEGNGRLASAPVSANGATHRLPESVPAPCVEESSPKAEPQAKKPERPEPPKAAPEPPKAAQEPSKAAESRNGRPVQNTLEMEVDHPLDAHLSGLNQEKLSAFLVSKGFIKPGQNYKWCGPNATSRILKQLPNFLKAAGFDEELVP